MGQSGFLHGLCSVTFSQVCFKLPFTHAQQVRLHLCAPLSVGAPSKDVKKTSSLKRMWNWCFNQWTGCRQVGFPGP